MAAWCDVNFQGGNYRDLNENQGRLSAFLATPMKLCKDFPTTEMFKNTSSRQIA